VQLIAPNKFMPCLPGFQFWAESVCAGVLSPVHTFGAREAEVLFTCHDNISHAINHHTVTLAIGGKAFVFEFIESGSPSPGHIAVNISNGDSANTVAAALQSEMASTVASALPGAATVEAASGAVVPVLANDPSVPLEGLADAPLTVSVQALGSSYGMFMLPAWVTFSYAGYDPANLVEDPGVLLPFYPLCGGPAVKAWPGFVDENIYATPG